MRFFVYVTLIAALLVSFVPAQAMLAATVVEPANMNGWLFGQETPGGGHIDFVSGPEPAPLGKGSAHFVLDNGTAGWTMGTALPTRTNLLDLTTLRYSTYVKANNSSQAVALQFDIDYDSEDAETGWQGRLVFDPSIAGTVTKSTWQEWNTIQDGAKWFGTRGAGLSECPMGTPCTWSEIKTKFPRASVTAISLKAGSGWASLFDGNADALVIGVSGVDTTFDFEPASIVYVDDDWSAVPYGTDPDATGPAHLMGFDASATVQGGVHIVAAGGKVNVAAGTYTEQVIVRNVEGITIEGAGETATVIVSPTQLVSIKIGADNRFGVIMADNVDALALKNLTVDGAGRGNAHYKFYGVVYHNTGGMFDHITVKGVRNTPLDGSQSGVALYAYNEDNAPRLLTLQNSTIFDYQKGGIVFNGAGLNVNLIDNTITGVGPTSVIAMNGVQIGFGAKGLIEGNTISGHEYTGPNWSASGLLLYDEAITLTGNAITNNQVGLWASNATPTLSFNRVSNNGWGIVIGGGTADVIANTIVDNEYGVDVYGSVETEAYITHNRFARNANAVVNEVDGANIPVVTAIDNWWGCNEGPNDEPGDCDTTTGPVVTTTWLKLTLSADKTHVLNGSPANLLATLTINSADVDVSGEPGFPVEDVLFATTLGEVNPGKSDMVDGSAASVLTVGPWANYETATVSVALDNETVTLDLLAGLRHFWMPIIHDN